MPDAAAVARRVHGWLKRQLSGAALLLITLTAVLEGVYILQTLSSRPTAQPKISRPRVAEALATSGARSAESAELRQAPPMYGGGSGLVTASKSQKKTLSGQGWVAVSSPVDLDVFEGNALLGTTRGPRLMLPPGRHTLRLVNEATGYDRFHRVEITPGRGSSVKIDLPMGLIHVNALPWAEVLIDGRSVGETPIGNLSLSVGRHEVIFRHPTLGEKTLSAVIKAGVLTRLSADMR